MGRASPAVCSTTRLHRPHRSHQVSSDAPLGTYGAIDCGAYINSFVLAGCALGVTAIAQAALAAYPDFWRAELGLAADRHIVCGISLGFEDADHSANRFRTSCAEVESAVTWLESFHEH